MSERAITIRLKQTDQLRELSLSLIKAKREHDERQAKPENSAADLLEKEHLTGKKTN